MFIPRFSIIFATLLLVLPAFAAEKRPIEIEDLFRLKRVSDPQISPDAKWVAYVITDVLKEENRTNADIWLVAADASAGGTPKKLTNSPRHDRHPRWSPDGKWIAFESLRDGSSQIYLLPIDGGEARKLTSLSTGASQPVWSPDGKMVAFISSVFPEFSEKPFAEADKLNKDKLDAREKSKVKARLIDKLLYRHWDEWVDDKRQHLFVVQVKSNGEADGDPRNVTPGENDAVPTSSTFSEGDEYAFSPDSKELAFCAPPLPIRAQAWSTNHDLWSVNLATGARRQLTTNPAADGYPRFSPDGKYIAYRAQSRPGAEADRWQLMLLDRATGQHRSLTANFDRSVGTMVWAPDGSRLFFDAQAEGTVRLWSVAVAGGAPVDQVSSGVNAEFSVTPEGKRLVFSHQRFFQPPDVFTQPVDEPKMQIIGAEPFKPMGPQPLTNTNAELLANINLQSAEVVTLPPQADGTRLHMWVMRPPGFDGTKKYPLVFWVHGGPQSAFLDSWSTRWNPQLWAAQGYIVAMPNPRGSTGFGQKFTDDISHDWGGKVFDDLMACLAYLETRPDVDTARMAAAGASYGGYMMNWFQGHTDKFKTLITHCGVYDFISMYGTTEETWFDEWEHGIPWENPEFEKFSPHRHAAKFKTPNLVIHNELDFRVPFAQGMSLFTTLQRKGIPSKLLYFPDEGHWVLKPQNSELWHKTIFDWLAVYLSAGDPRR